MDFCDDRINLPLFFSSAASIDEWNEMTSNIQLDAEWKRIQEKTFTRWCNEQLKIIEVSIEDLSKDLINGVILITLLEILSQKRIGRYNKKPRIHAQRMENVDMALDFITKTEKIRLVNIGKSVLLHACFLHGQLSYFCIYFR